MRLIYINAVLILCVISFLEGEREGGLESIAAFRHQLRDILGIF